MVKRRRGSRTARAAGIARHRPDRHRPFELLVERALAGIPMPFAAALNEVAVVIEDAPTGARCRTRSACSDFRSRRTSPTPRISRTRFGSP